MKTLKFLTKAIAIIILFRGLFLLLGSILYMIDVMNGLEKIKSTFYTQFPYYILLVISAWGILKSKKWGVYLLFALLIYDILYWVVLGYYQPLIKMALAVKYPIVKIYGFIMIFCKRLLIPMLLFIFFSLPKVKEDLRK